MKIIEYNFRPNYIICYLVVRRGTTITNTVHIIVHHQKILVDDTPIRIGIYKDTSLNIVSFNYNIGISLFDINSIVISGQIKTTDDDTRSLNCYSIDACIGAPFLNNAIIL